MTDYLGAVNDFILAHCWRDPDLPALVQDQVVRGWQNVVSALPADSQEYAVLTLLASTRHGTNVHKFRNAEGPTGVIETVSRMAEHLVQVDFCCAYPQQGEEYARLRAEILEILTRDRVGVDFFKGYGFSACYADDLRPLPFQNEAEQWVARYSVTMHLSGWTGVDLSVPSFDAVDLYLEDVDVHHPVEDTPPVDRPYDVENLADAKEGYAFSHIGPKQKP